jgi:hypothetical protein
MKIEVQFGRMFYTIEDNQIDVYKYCNLPFKNGYGTIYELKGTKTVEVFEYNSTWACRGMGMNGRRYTKIVNQNLYNRIKEIIEKVKEINETEKDEDIKFEKLAEVLKSVDTNLHEDYSSDEEDDEYDE